MGKWMENGKFMRIDGNIYGKFMRFYVKIYGKTMEDRDIMWENVLKSQISEN